VIVGDELLLGKSKKEVLGQEKVDCGHEANKLCGNASVLILLHVREGLEAQIEGKRDSETRLGWW
jgi:hypothetical protein